MKKDFKTLNSFLFTPLSDVCMCFSLLNRAIAHSSFTYFQRFSKIANSFLPGCMSLEFNWKRKKKNRPLLSLSLLIFLTQCFLLFLPLDFSSLLFRCPSTWPLREGTSTSWTHSSSAALTSTTRTYAIAKGERERERERERGVERERERVERERGGERMSEGCKVSGRDREDVSSSVVCVGLTLLFCSSFLGIIVLPNVE